MIQGLMAVLGPLLKAGIPIAASLGAGALGGKDKKESETKYRPTMSDEQKIMIARLYNLASDRLSGKMPEINQLAINRVREGGSKQVGDVSRAMAVRPGEDKDRLLRILSEQVLPSVVGSEAEIRAKSFEDAYNMALKAGLNPATMGTKATSKGPGSGQGAGMFGQGFGQMLGSILNKTDAQNTNLPGVNAPALSPGNSPVPSPAEAQNLPLMMGGMTGALNGQQAATKGANMQGMDALLKMFPQMLNLFGG